MTREPNAAEEEDVRDGDSCGVHREFMWTKVCSEAVVLLHAKFKKISDVRYNGLNSTKLQIAASVKCLGRENGNVCTNFKQSHVDSSSLGENVNQILKDGSASKQHLLHSLHANVRVQMLQMQNKKTAAEARCVWTEGAQRERSWKYWKYLDKDLLQVDVLIKTVINSELHG
ncbi:uncharacterized protein V6R79_015143 [Siganus canaliculatus]